MDLRCMKKLYLINYNTFKCGYQRNMINYPNTLIYINYVFGNKRNLYTIEPLVKKADFYLQSQALTYARKIMLSDGLGINQGQKDTTRINENIFLKLQKYHR